MDLDVNKMRELLDKRDEIDDQIAALVAGNKERKPQRCSVCLAEGHSARTCPKKPTVSP